MTIDADLRDGLLVGAEVLAGYLEAVTRTNTDEEDSYFSDPSARRDAQEAYDDLRRLARGEDARYDLVLSGDLYAAWYQMRRVVHAIGVLAHQFVDTGDSDLDILDIGCGTGATAWAAAIIERARVASGHVPRRVRVIGLDGSPFMTSTAGNLWNRLDEALDLEGVEATFSTASWRNFATRTRDLVLEDPLLVGGYVLDHSDEESVSELAEDLGALVDTNGIGRLVLFGSAKKQPIVARLIETLRSTAPRGTEWTATDGEIARAFVPSTDLTPVAKARRRLLEVSGVTAVDARGIAWMSAPESGFVFARRAGQATLAVGRRPIMTLDVAQTAAAAPSEGAALVIGAAGSGKSEVLVRRVIATLEEAVRGPSSRTAREPQRVLVTAFNKYMVDYLVRRVEEELAGLTDPIRIKYNRCGSDCGSCLHAPKDEGAVDCTLFVGNLPAGARIRFLNWDKVFTRLLGAQRIQGRPNSSSFLSRSSIADRTVLTKAKITDSFLEAEFLRVIYGQRLRTSDEYVSAVRRGRGSNRIPRDIRPAVWRAIDPMSERDTARGFTKVRYDTWSSGAELPEQERFDVVIVDEGQDLTEADFDIVGRLVKPEGSVVVALDPAQSQQLGASFHLPGPLEIPGRQARRSWMHHELSKTHRLSIAISTAVRPLADTVRGERGEMSALVPRKSSMIGARPIMVDVRTSDDMGQIANILQRYEGYFRPDFGETPVTSLLCAGDHEWYGSLDHLLRDWAQDGVTRISRGAVDRRQQYFNGEWKGLEFDAVVWLTDARLGWPQQTMDSTLEWVYTVVSRPRSLLVIGLTPGTDDATRHAVSRLDEEGLRFWDPDWSREVFAEWNQHASGLSDHV
jgi:SAM-dependent methyltransferase